MKNGKFLIMEILFFAVTLAVFCPVIIETHDIVMKNTPYNEMVSETIKLYVRNTIMGKAIATYAILVILYYIIVRKIGILFVCSWITAAGLCGLAESWLSYDYFFGSTIVGAITTACTFVAYIVVAIIYLIKYLYKRYRMRKSGE